MDYLELEEGTFFLQHHMAEADLHLIKRYDLIMRAEQKINKLDENFHTCALILGIMFLKKCDIRISVPFVC